MLAVATSVLVVAVTVAATGHFIRFVQEGGDSLTTVLSLCIFTVPGVVLGGLTLAEAIL